MRAPHAHPLPAFTSIPRTHGARRALPCTGAGGARPREPASLLSPTLASLLSPTRPAIPTLQNVLPRLSQHWLVVFLCNEVGIELSSAGQYASLVFAFSLVGKVAFGPALDSKHRRLAALGGCALFTLGGALMLRPQRAAGSGALELVAAASHPQLVAFAVCYGLGYGAAFTIVQSRAAHLYGQSADFSTLQSALAVAQYLGSFLGVLVTAQLREATGSYVAPFSLFPLLGLLICGHCWCVFRVPRARQDGDACASVVDVVLLRAPR